MLICELLWSIFFSISMFCFFYCMKETFVPLRKCLMKMICLFMPGNAGFPFSLNECNITMDFHETCGPIHGPPMKNYNECGDPLTFPASSTMMLTCLWFQTFQKMTAEWIDIPFWICPREMTGKPLLFYLAPALGQNVILSNCHSFGQQVAEEGPNKDETRDHLMMASHHPWCQIGSGL